jgi:hypothetical protein
MVRSAVRVRLRGVRASCCASLSFPAWFLEKTDDCTDGNALYKQANVAFPQRSPTGQALALFRGRPNSLFRQPFFCIESPPMKAMSIAIPVLFMLLVSLAGAQSNEDLLKKRFLSEYPEALKAWEARISKVEATVKYTEDDPRKKVTPHREVLSSFKCKLPDMMVLTTISNDAKGQREQAVSGSNKNYSFALIKRGEGTDLALTRLDAANGSDGAPSRSPMRSLSPQLWVPYAARTSNVSLLSNPLLDVRRVSTVTRNRRNLLKVEFDLPTELRSKVGSNTASESSGREGFFLVSPEEKWVLCEYEYARKKGEPRLLYKGTVDYQGTVDGFPIPKRAARQTLKLPEGELVETYSYDFLDFRFADVPDKDFTLAAFGIPEEVTQTAKVARSRSVGYWLLAISLIALAAAVFFKMAASRRKPSLSS